MERINVLIYEPYPFSQVAGNLRTQSYIIKFVDRAKFNIILLSPRETDFTCKMRDRGIDTVIMPPSKRIDRYGGSCLKDGLTGRLLTIVDILRYSLEVRKLFKEKKIDVVYCNCIRAVLTVGLAAVLGRARILWYIKGSLNNRFLDFIGFVMSSRILFFCGSNMHDKYPLLVKWNKRKIGILKIGINPEVINEIEVKDRQALKKELDIDGGYINLIVLGQLYRPKGVHYLIQALAMASVDFPKIRLYIVGDHIIEEYKDYKDELTDLIWHNKLTDNVIFTGWRKDALEIVSLMDILVHPSLTEGFGRAVLEAMALGKPVIASRVGGLREIIKDGENGFLVEPGDYRVIAEKLSLLLKDKGLREALGREAKKTVFSQYLLPDKISQLQDIWRDMAKGKK